MLFNIIIFFIGRRRPVLRQSVHALLQILQGICDIKNFILEVLTILVISITFLRVPPF